MGNAVWFLWEPEVPHSLGVYVQKQLQRAVGLSLQAELDIVLCLEGSGIGWTGEGGSAVC